jgi:hypothetical protein
MAGNEYDRNRASVRTNSRCKSSPLRPGKRTSRTRQAGALGLLCSKNSRADLNASTESPTEVIKSVRVSRMDESSSTTNAIGSPVFMCCLQLKLAKQIGMSRQGCRLRAVNCPSCASTIEQQIHKPMRMPSGFVTNNCRGWCPIPSDRH